MVAAAFGRATVVVGAAVVGVTVVDTSATVAGAEETGTVDSASTAAMGPSEEPEAQTRSSTSSGRHTMVATMASVNERCGEERMEDRTKTFGQGQDRPGPMVRRAPREDPTPPGATRSP